jgi:hypothetical protein
VLVALMVVLRGFATSLVSVVRTHLQQLAAGRKFFLSVAIGEEAVVADPLEAVWKDV